MVVFQNKDLDDLIILRSDGNPTYNLSVVVDDHDMGVTHIIRGVDHLTNAARQTQIYHGDGLGRCRTWRIFRSSMGRTAPSSRSAMARWASRPIAPWAICRRRCATIWRASAGAMAMTRFSRPSKMIEWFDLDGIGKSPARFDFAKLENLNGHYIRTRRMTSWSMHFVAFSAACRRAAPEMLARIDVAMQRQARPRHARPQGARQDVDLT